MNDRARSEFKRTVVERAIHHVAFSLVLIAFPGCFGGPVELVDEVVSSSGGTVQVSREGHELDGLTLSVPEGAFSEDTRIMISRESAPSLDLPEGVSAASPVIHVDNDSKISREMITLSIPIRLEPGHFAMPFYLGGNNTLRAMPVLSLTEDRVKTLARHFSSLVVLQVNLAVMQAQGRVAVPYDPTRDSWHFINNGDFSEPLGVCQGMTAGLTWYFQAMPREDRMLSTHSDNTGMPFRSAKISGDDDRARKFVTALQKHHGTYFGSQALQDNWNQLMREEDNNPGGFPTNMYRSIVTSLFITGSPQPVTVLFYIRHRSGALEGAGHALLAVGADLKTGTLQVYDPNYTPGTNRELVFRNGAFKPYVGALNARGLAAGGGERFDHVYFLGTDLLTGLDHSSMSQLWKKAMTGKLQVDGYPEIILERLNSKSKVVGTVKRHLVSDIRDVSIRPRVDGRLVVDGEAVTLEYSPCMVDKNGKDIVRKGFRPLSRPTTVPMNSKGAYVGFEFRTRGGKLWAGYKWIKLARVWISPAKQEVAVRESFEFELKTDFNLKEPTYQWYVDKKELPGKTGKTLKGHFKRPGRKIVSCVIDDPAKNLKKTVRAVVQVEGEAEPLPTRREEPEEVEEPEKRQPEPFYARQRELYDPATRETNYHFEDGLHYIEFFQDGAGSVEGHMRVNKDKNGKFYIHFPRTLKYTEGHGMSWLMSVRFGGAIEGRLQPWGQVKASYKDESGQISVKGKWKDKRTISGTWQVVDRSKNRKASGSWRIVCPDGYYWVME